MAERCTPGFSSLSIFINFPLTLYYISTIFHYFLSLQEYPLDDLCNEVIERWKTSRANVLQEKELVKGKNCVTSQLVFHLAATDLGQRPFFGGVVGQRH